MRAIAWLTRMLSGPDNGDGFGQSWADDLRYRERFRACRRRPVAWRMPTDHEAARWNEHPVVGRFGDMLAIATVSGRLWIVRDRLWHGWPDPPEFVFFAMAGEEVWAAADFHRWPVAWGAGPPGATTTPRP